MFRRGRTGSSAIRGLPNRFVIACATALPNWPVRLASPSNTLPRSTFARKTSSPDTCRARRPSRPGPYHLGDGSLQHLQALARQTDASHLLAGGYRQMPALLFLLHRRRIGPDLSARADMVSVPPPVLLQRT